MSLRQMNVARLRPIVAILLSICEQQECTSFLLELGTPTKQPKCKLASMHSSLRSLDLKSNDFGNVLLRNYRGARTTKFNCRKQMKADGRGATNVSEIASRFIQSNQESELLSHESAQGMVTGGRRDLRLGGLGGQDLRGDYSEE